VTGLRAASAALATTLATTLCVLLAGCSATPERVGVDPQHAVGETPPAITPELAARVLQRYLAAMRRPDAATIAAVESGAARLVDTELRALGPQPVDLAANFAIPRLARYPKWFAAGAVEADLTGDVAIFVQARRDGPWRANRVVRLTVPMPALTRDAAGYVTAVTPPDTALRQAKALTSELQAPAASPRAEEAVAGVLDGLRRNRGLFAGARWATAHKITTYGQSYALRTKDGGTVVWYVLGYAFVATNTAGSYEIALADEAARLLGRASVRRQLSWQALYQSAAHVPAAGPERVLGISPPGWIRMTGG
jgi:hypothetical protein